VAQTCNEAGAESFPLHCDIAQIDSIESTVKTAIDRLDGLHYLINCAGVSAKEKLHETDLTSSDRFLIQILEHTCISLDIHSRKLTGMSVAR
jgi:NAD(P)-dependent dehydrogenase (short-subunit alcohol dehydrogenase family)